MSMLLLQIYHICLGSMFVEHENDYLNTYIQIKKTDSYTVKSIQKLLRKSVAAKGTFFLCRKYIVSELFKG